jgi:phytoene synthase
MRPRCRRVGPLDPHLRHGRGAWRELAHQLGRALQLTNIVRDLDEEPRSLLPREILVRRGSRARTRPSSAMREVDDACRALAAQALDHFAAADRLLRSSRARCWRRG